MMNENHNISPSISEISQPCHADSASVPVQPHASLSVPSSGGCPGASRSLDPLSHLSGRLAAADSPSADSPSVVGASRLDYGFLTDVIHRDPAAAHMIVDLISGDDPARSFHRHFPDLAPDADALRRAEQSGYDRGRRDAAEAVFSLPSPGEEPVESAAMRHRPDIADSLLGPASRSVWDD